MSTTPPASLSDLTTAAETALTGLSNAHGQTQTDQNKLASLQAAITTDLATEGTANQTALTALQVLDAAVQAQIAALTPTPQTPPAVPAVA